MSNRVLSGPHFITTAPSLTVCAGCRTPILAVTVGGLDRHIDLTPLTDAGELAALLAGRATYDLRGEHLIRRYVERVAAGRRELPVLAGHACRVIDPGHVDQAAAGAVAGLLARLAGADDAPLLDSAPF